MSNMNGKGDKRRPMIIDDRQLEFKWQVAFQRQIDAMTTKLKNEVAMAYGDNYEQEK